MTGEGEIATHEETLQILSEMARNGSVTAAASLERALRATADKEEDEVDNAIDRILARNPDEAQ